MKLFSAAEIRSWDQYTIQHEPITSIELMERAARACSDYILKYSPEQHFQIICGSGNNGGDGLAIARMLIDAGKNVKTYIQSPVGSNDYNINLERLNSIQKVYTWNDFIPDKTAVIIDAIFGTGLNRASEGAAAQMIASINASGLPIISIDIPSGLPADFCEAPQHPVVKAHLTLTFQIPKQSFLLPETGSYCGKWEILNIGLSSVYHHRTATSYIFSDTDYIKSFLKERPEFSHKGTFGHAYLYAGASNYCGAMILSATGILRSGAGLLTVATDPACITALLTRLPEAMIATDAELKKYNVYAAGPGLGQENKHLIPLLAMIETRKPLVIDADALNMLSHHGFPEFHQNILLTPHPGEMRRIIGMDEGSIYTIWKRAAQFAQEKNCYILLKGKHSCLWSPDGTALFNSTGNSGLAKGGSGDMLTGIITGLLAQGYTIREAAALGMWLHGKCAELAVAESAAHYILPEDLPDYLGKAWKELLHI